MVIKKMAFPGNAIGNSKEINLHKSFGSPVFKGHAALSNRVAALLQISILRPAYERSAV